MERKSEEEEEERKRKKENEKEAVEEDEETNDVGPGMILRSSLTSLPRGKRPKMHYGPEKKKTPER